MSPQGSKSLKDAKTADLDSISRVPKIFHVERRFPQAHTLGWTQKLLIAVGVLKSLSRSQTTYFKIQG